MTDTQNISQEIEQELKTLQSLKEQGHISDQEFEKAQNALYQKAKDSGLDLAPMGLIETYMHTWRNLYNIKGRATRSEFFLFVIINAIIVQLLPVISEFVFHTTISKNIEVFTSFIVSLLTLSLYIRRFHDTNRSGIVPTILTLCSTPIIYFLPLIEYPSLSLGALPFIIIALLIYCVLAIYAFFIILFRGTEGWNKYGRRHPSKPRVKYSIITFFILTLFTPVLIGGIAGYQSAVNRFEAEQQADMQAQIEELQAITNKMVEETLSKDENEISTEAPNDEEVQIVVDRDGLPLVHPAPPMEYFSAEQATADANADTSAEANTDATPAEQAPADTNANAEATPAEQAPAEANANANTETSAEANAGTSAEATPAEQAPADTQE